MSALLAAGSGKPAEASSGLDSILNNWNKKFEELQHKIEQQFHSLTAESDNLRQNRWHDFEADLAVANRASSEIERLQANRDVNNHSEEILKVEEKQKLVQEKLQQERNRIVQFEEDKFLKKQRLEHLAKKVAQKGEEVKSGAGSENNKTYIDLCKIFLGLEIHPSTRNTFLFVFNMLDRNNENQKFTAEVKVAEEDGDKPYQILRCNPEIEDVSALEDALIKTGNISTFVISLRKSFLAML